MRDIPWSEEFDAAFCFGGSFGYFDDEGNRRHVASVSRSLKPEGRFLIDAHTLETLLPVFQERDWGHRGDDLILQDRSFDHETTRVGAQWTIIHQGHTSQRSSSMRIYTYRELCQLLAGVGFIINDTSTKPATVQRVQTTAHLYARQ
jgi:SAM-dependent methyltransferase